MATVTLKGTPTHTSGELPAKASQAPQFELVKADLSTLTLRELAGKKVILNIFPSVDTDVCANSVRHFNETAAQLANTLTLCISADLPFAFQRFCAAEGIHNVIGASAFRSSFGRDYGIEIQDGPLKGLLARCVVILDESGKVIYQQLVPEITEEPDYDAALHAIA
jgi:thioredoxin-dependent peroxiredoxin